MNPQRMSRKAIFELADINTEAAPGTYFPAPEPLEKIAYSCGTYGCTGQLFRGICSGLLYATGRYNLTVSIRDMGARECAVVERLERCEATEEAGRDVFRFVAKDGSSFTVANEASHGHRWQIVG